MKSKPIGSDTMVLVTLHGKIAGALVGTDFLDVGILSYMYSKGIQYEALDSKLAAQIRPIPSVLGNSICNTHIRPSQFISATTDRLVRSSFAYVLVESRLRCPKTSETVFSGCP